MRGSAALRAVRCAGAIPTTAATARSSPRTIIERGGSRCRNFVHKVWIDGRPQAMRGTACRNPDGTWTQVS